MPAENNVQCVMVSSCSNFVCAAEKSTPAAFQDLLCFGYGMYFSYSPSGEGLHLLVLMCLCDSVASMLSGTAVQKVAVMYSIYPLEVEGTGLCLVQEAWLLHWPILKQ